MKLESELRQKGSMQKLEAGIWEEYKDIIYKCRNGVRKAKAQRSCD